MLEITSFNATQEEISRQVELGIFREVCRYEPPAEMAQRFLLIPLSFGLIWNALRKLNEFLSKSGILGCPTIDTWEKKLIVVFFPMHHFEISQNQIQCRLTDLKSRVDSYLGEMHTAIAQQPIADWKIPLPASRASGAPNVSNEALDQADDLRDVRPFGTTSEGEIADNPNGKSESDGQSDVGKLHGKGRKSDRSLSSSSSVEGILGNWNPRDRTFRISGAGFHGKINYDARQQDAVHSAVIFSNASVAVRVAEEHTTDGLIFRLERIEGLDPQLQIDIEICPLCHGMGQAPDQG